MSARKEGQLTGAAAASVGSGTAAAGAGTTVPACSPATPPVAGADGGAAVGSNSGTEVSAASSLTSAGGCGDDSAPAPSYAMGESCRIAGPSPAAAASSYRAHASERRGRVALVVSATLCLVAALAAVMLGSTNVSLSDVLAVLTGGQTSTPAAANIVEHVRLPRMLAGVLAGAALAVSGCITQTVLNNPLASPNVLGINSGAGLAVLLASALLPNVAAALPAAAFGGALLTALLVFAVASVADGSRMTIVLVGMAATAVFGAGMNTVLIVNPDAYVGASTFLVGGLAGVRMVDLVWPAVCIVVGLVVALLGSRALNVMLTGDAVAQGVGMNVRAVRLGMLAVAALLAGAAVSFAGLLGFVGLIVPHVVRLITGNDLRFLMPVSMFGGAAFVCACDLFARTLFAPYELAVGILMAFVGGPFFVWLVVRGKGRDL